MPTVHVRQDPVDSYEIKDILRTVVVNVNSEQEKVVVSLSRKDLSDDRPAISLGLITHDELPKYYRWVWSLVFSHLEYYCNSFETSWRNHKNSAIRPCPSTIFTWPSNLGKFGYLNVFRGFNGTYLCSVHYWVVIWYRTDPRLISFSLFSTGGQK